MVYDQTYNTNQSDKRKYKMVEEVLNEYRMLEWKKKKKRIKRNQSKLFNDNLFLYCLLVVVSFSLSLRKSQLSRPNINIQTHFWIPVLSFSLTHSVLSTNLQITSNSRSMPLTAGCYLIIFDSYSMWHESNVRRKLKYEQRLLHFKHKV